MKIKTPQDLRPKLYVNRIQGITSKYVFIKKNESKRSAAFWVKRLRNPKVITLSGVAPSISVDDDCLVIRNGITIADLNPSESRHARGVHGLQWVILDTYNGMLTVDALRWLHAQGVGLLLIHGLNVQVLHEFQKPVVSLRRKQYCSDSLTVARYILKGKFAGILECFPSIDNADEYHDLIHGDGLDGVTDIQNLILLEGRIARSYWDFQRFNLNSFKKFPDWWREFNNRASGINTPSNKNATHPINAILNYGYAVAAGMIKKKAMMIGLDVACGSLHADNDRRDSLTYDLLELLRADVDKILLHGFARKQKFRRTDFSVNEKGVVSLEVNLRRVIAEKIVTLDKKIDLIVKKYTLFLLAKC